MRIGVEAAGPEAVADERDVGTAVMFFRGCEVAAQLGRDAPDLKKARCDERVVEPLRERTRGFGFIFGVVAADGLEGVIEAVPVFEPRRCGEGPRLIGADVVLT